MRGLPQSQREGGQAFGGSFRYFVSKLPVSAVSLLVLACVAIFWPAGQLRSDNFVLYFPSNHVLLPFETLDNTKYLVVLHVLNAVGKVGGLQEKKNSLRVWFGPNLIELRPDDKKVRVEETVVSLTHPVRISNGQWLVPVDFLTTVLPLLTHQAVEYQEGTNRIFLGDVQPGSFTVRLDPLADGARLTLQFTGKVAVHTASSNGKWVLFLGDRPLEPAEGSYHFQNAYVKDLEFDDQDGLPKLILTPASGGLNFYPVQAEGGKALVADVVKPPPTAAQTPGTPPAGGQPAAPAAAPQSTGIALPPNEQPPAGPPPPVVVLDAGHGGGETGGRSRDGVSEKDITAQFVGRVRTALLNTNKYRVLLTRNSDVDTSLEQRALVANLSGALYFLSFHAADLGPPTRHIAVFSFQPATALASTAAETPRVFIPWAQVQEGHIDQSRQLALALQQQFSHLDGVQVDLPTTAPVRVLRNINSAAVAIEVGRLAADAEAAPLTDPGFQQQVATTVVDALASLEKGGV